MTLARLISRTSGVVAPGVYDGLSATLAADAGFEVLYLSGFSVAGTLLGKPDIGLLTASEMSAAVARVVNAARGVPVIADADNGYGGLMNVVRTVHEFERAGASAIQLEDQVHPKRCGHMENKAVVPKAEAALKIKAAVDTRDNATTLIIARTDAIATDGLDDALARADAYLAAGADVLFVEAPRDLASMQIISSRFRGVPLVANLVEDGKTPLASIEELARLGFTLVLRPVTALLHVAAVLQATYSGLSEEASDTPSSRLGFADFNQLVGLGLADDYADRLNSD